VIAKGGFVVKLFFHQSHPRDAPDSLNRGDEAAFAPESASGVSAVSTTPVERRLGQNGRLRGQFLEDLSGSFNCRI
jgi:hypothetical protein